MRGAAVKLALFTAVTILFTFGLAAVIGNLHPFEDVYTVKAVFSDASGVLRGDLVKIAGVDVGKVTGFEVEDGQAVVSMEIFEHVEIPANVVADLKFRNLLGQRVINLERPQTPSSRTLQDGDSIPVDQTRPALDITLVFNNLRPLIQSTNPKDINTVSRALLEVLEGREGDVERILANVGDLTRSLSGRDQRLARLVADLDELTRALNRQSGSVRTGIERFGEVMAALAETTPRIERTVVQLDAAARRLERTLKKNRGNLDRELADLATLLGIVDDNLEPLARASRNLKEVVLAIARSQSYGRWLNVYAVNECIEPTESLPPPGGCRR